MWSYPRALRDVVWKREFLNARPPGEAAGPGPPHSSAQPGDTTQQHSHLGPQWRNVEHNCSLSLLSHRQHTSDVGVCVCVSVSMCLLVLNSFLRVWLFYYYTSTILHSISFLFYGYCKSWKEPSIDVCLSCGTWFILQTQRHFSFYTSLYPPAGPNTTQH